MIAIHYILAISLFLNSCAKHSMNSDLQPTVPEVNRSLSYLALGDSYTIGQGVLQTERFPFYVSSMLRNDSLDLGDPEYIATTGWTTANLQSAISAANLNKTYDVVTLLIGVNDQYQGLDTAGYRVRFTNLLNRSIRLTGNRISRVFVLSIPDYSATPFVENSQKKKVSIEIDLFNSINRDVTIQHRIAYIDITPSTREAANDPTLLTTDGLHYSGNEHKKWAAKLVPLIAKELQ